ncbi:MAG TPA: hypothetical protein VJS67_13750 [Pseudonocardiaceae bacterium]|nr:hypothetical protein [Pseudonocardiaceae bacterium]
MTTADLRGPVAVLVIYLLHVTRGSRAGLSVRDTFPKLLAAGLSTTLTLRVFTGHRRRYRPHPGDWTHHPVPVLRWLFPAGQLALRLRISRAARQPAPTPPDPHPVPLASATTKLITRPST